MANPRKFSEKIALHAQKQAEETAAFDEIMRQVQSTTRVCFTLFYLSSSTSVPRFCHNDHFASDSRN